MTGVGDDSRGRLLGRPWLVVGFTLAIGATLALVLSDDLRWLRLGIIAALWAAVIGGFLAVHYRKHAAHSEDAVAEAQAVYELELEREIAARREYELEIEAESRERAETDSRDELDALRAEVIALRDSLQSLFGGEVLLERVALTAQATRMRSVGEDHRLVSSSESKAKPAPAQLPAGKRPAETPERPTELMDRVQEPAKVPDKRHKVVQQNQTASQTTQYSPVTPVTPIRIKPEENGKPVRRPQTDVAARVAKPLPDRAEATRRQQAPVEQRLQRPAERPAAASPERRQPAASSAPQPSQAMPSPVKPPQPKPAPAKVPSSATRKTEQVERKPELARPAAASYPPAARKPEPVEEESFRAAEPEWQPAWTNGHRERPASDLSAAFGSRRDLPPVSVPEVANARHGSHRSGDGLSVSTPEVSRSVPPSAAPEPVVANDTPLDFSSAGGGRRRRAEDIPAAPAEAPASGGRRRRPDGEPPSWQAEEAASNGSRHSNGSNGSSRPSNGSAPLPPPSGSHSRPDNGSSNGSNGSNGHRSAAAHGTRYSEPEPAEAGSHAAGRSVTELLAAHGASESTPRRRRRAED
jgi:hypothetical protein